MNRMQFVAFPAHVTAADSSMEKIGNCFANRMKDEKQNASSLNRNLFHFHRLCKFWVNVICTHFGIAKFLLYVKFCVCLNFQFFFHFVYPLVSLSIPKGKFLISPRVNVNYIKNLAEELSLVAWFHHFVSRPSGKLFHEDKAFAVRNSTKCFQLFSQEYHDFVQ